MTAAHAIPPSRQGLIAKIHIAKNQLALTECSYRALLMGATGKDSCRDMGTAELERVLSAFEKAGFKARPKTKKTNGRSQADSDQSRKIRALWLMLYHLGEVQDSSEEALEIFVRRKTKISAFQWLKPDDADKVIKALKGWLVRTGYHFPDAADYHFFGTEGLAENISLLNRQSYILGINELYPWLENNGFGKINSLREMSRDDMFEAIKILGAKIRKQKKNAHV